MRYTISQVGQSLMGADSYGNTHTSVKLQEFDREVYIVHQPKNMPYQGQVVEGTVGPDRNGRMKFTKERLNAQPQQRSYSSGQTVGGSKPQPNQQFKADPAKADSIENQSYYKQAVDLLRIHVELNPEVYVNKPIRELNDKVITEAIYAKTGMRNPVKEVFPDAQNIKAEDFPSDQPPMSAYENDPEAGWK